jgi:phosphatidylserine/phosphatidylglycerophosphate/cardiolipin synthase-like enzyme
MNLPVPALRSLGVPALEDLARVLDGGHLSAEASAFQIQRTVRAVHSQAAEELAELLRSGLQPRHAALLLATILAERRQPGCSLEVVTSGPDAKGATRDTGVVMRELFSVAEERVLVVGFAVHQGRQVFRALADRMEIRPRLAVRLCLDVSRRPGDTSKASGILERFATRFREREWPGTRLPEVFYDPRALTEADSVRASLHAKCVVVDGHTAFVGSANLTEAAQQRNIEVGLIVRTKGVAHALETHFDALIRHGFLKALSSWGKPDDR